MQSEASDGRVEIKLTSKMYNEEFCLVRQQPKNIYTQYLFSDVFCLELYRNNTGVSVIYVSFQRTFEYSIVSKGVVPQAANRVTGDPDTQSTVGILLKYLYTKVKSKVCIRAKWPMSARAYPGFSSMKRLEVFPLPPGWDSSPSHGYSWQ